MISERLRGLFLPPFFSCYSSLTAYHCIHAPGDFSGWNYPHLNLTHLFLILIQDEKYMRHDQMRVISS